MLKIRKVTAFATAALVALSLFNLGAQGASAAAVTLTLSNPNPVTDVTTGSTVSQAGVIGDTITITSSAALTSPVTVDFTGASSVEATGSGTTFSVKIPAGSVTGTVGVTDSNGNYGTSGAFQIWASRTEPYVMPSGHLNITYTDLKRILDQIKIGEAHATRTAVAGSLTNRLNTRAASANPVYPFDVTSATRCLIAADLATAATVAYGATSLSDRYVYSNLNPWGVRTVDGACNNITNVVAETAPAGTYGFVSKTTDTAAWGATDQLFTRLAPATNTPSSGSTYNLNAVQLAYQDPSKSVRDPQPRIISNLISDQSTNNPAAVAAGTEANGILYGADGYESENSTNATTGVVSTSVKIPNVTSDYNVSAGFNSWFTWFGQFFDHGLDLIPKAGASVLIPLDQSDPVYVPNPQAPNFMILTRGADSSTGESVNITSPYIDQSQTYGSHPSQNFFLREYTFAAGTGIATSTGRMLESTDEKYTTLPSAWAGNHTIGGTLTHPTGSSEAANGGMPTWRDIKAQALLLGFALSDNDAGNIPVIATDQYGKYIPSSTNFPQMLFTNGSQFVWASGNPSSPLSTGVATSSAARGIALPGQSGSNWVAVETGHNFINDTMNSAVPATSHGTPLTPDADSIINSGTSIPTGFYDNESLDNHLVAGDGRINENIGLQAVHNAFHAEHNTVAKDITDELANNPAISTAFKNEWNGERLYQASRFVMEMEYQHMVYDEFARRISPSLPAFIGYDPTNNASITAEFASAIYRLGHSMLTETIPRANPGTSWNPLDNQDVSLIAGFTNPAQGRLQRPMTVLSALHDGTSIVYTLKSGETVPQVGSVVSVTGLDSTDDSAVNVNNAIVDSVDGQTFTVSTHYAGGSSSSAVDIANAGSPVESLSKVAETDQSAVALVSVNDPGSNAWTYTAAEQTAMIAQGLVAQRGQEIDEFTTDAVRNNLLGLPLDLASLNITRGRDTGLPTLNQFRGTTGGTLKPYSSWNDYIDALRYFPSGVNFLAAYGTYPTITAPVEIATPTSAVATDAGSGHVSITYTANVSRIHAGNIVSITGFSNSDLNVEFAVVDSVDADSFTVTTKWGHSPSATVAFASQGALFADQALPISGSAADETGSASVTRDPNTTERRNRAQAVLDSSSQDAIDFLNGVRAWDVDNGGKETGLNNIDLWIGGLAENPYKQPVTPPVLGPTFQYVFEDQLLKLQDGDRFYYLGRLAGSNLGEEIPAQKFTDIIRRNTPSTSAQVDIADNRGLVGLTSPGFSVTDCSFSNITELVSEALRCAANTLRVDGFGTLVHRGLDNITAFADLSSTAGARLAGGAGDDSIQGTSGSDYLSGGLSGGDTIDGFAGDDIIIGGAGEDLLKGGPGNDTINAGESQLGDIADGGSGVDFIQSGNSTGAAVSFIGEAGDDFIQGGKNADLLLEGGEGADWIEGGSNTDLLVGDLGIFGGALGSTSVYGGNDVLNGGPGNDFPGGDGGDDIINVGDGVDLADGGTGFDFMNYEGTKRFDNGITTKVSAYVDLSGVNPSLINSPVDGNINIEGVAGGPGNDKLFGGLGADFAVAGVTGVAGSTTIKLPGTVTTVVAGMQVSGPGIAAGASTVGPGAVATVNGVTTTTVDLTVPNTAAVNGTVNFTTYALTAPQTITGMTDLLSTTPGWTKYSNVTPGATKWTGGTILLGAGGNDAFTLVAGQNVVHGSAKLHTCIAVTNNDGSAFTTGADVSCASGRGYSTMSLISKYLDNGTVHAGNVRTVKELLSTNVDVTGFSSDGTNIVYTANNSYVIGDRVNVKGITTNGIYNVFGATVTAATATTFTVRVASPVATFTSVTARAGGYNTLTVPGASTAITLTPITGNLPVGAMTGYTLRTTATGAVDTVYDISAVTFSNAITTSLAPWVSTLSNLTSSAGTLSPAFNAGVGAYNVTVPTATATLRVTPTATAAGETITVNGVANASGVASANITLSTVGSTTITIAVTSADGSITSNYVLTALRQGLTPTLSARTSGATQLNSSITNYNALYTYSITSNAGAVTVGSATGTTLPFSITGIYGGQVVSITVQVSRAGYSTTTTTVTGTAAANMGLVPLFDTPVPTANGFTVNVINYRNTFSYSTSVTNGGSVAVGSASGSTLPITVSGLGTGAASTLTVFTTRAGSNVASASVTAISVASLGIQTSGHSAPQLPKVVTVAGKSAKAIAAAKAKAIKIAKAKAKALKAAKLKALKK